MSSNSKVSENSRGSGWLSSHGNGETCVLGSTPLSGYVELAIDDLQNDDPQPSRALYNMKQRESEISFFARCPDIDYLISYYFYRLIWL